MAEKKKTVTKKAVAPKKAAVKKPVSKKVAPKKEAPKKETAPKKEATPKKVDQSTDEGKQLIIDKFSTHSGDTGSPEVQVAILTWKIVNLQSHLEINQKDNHSRRGLLKIVSKRRRIMKYLRDKDEKRYQALEAKIKEYQAANK